MSASKDRCLQGWNAAFKAVGMGKDPADDFQLVLLAMPLRLPRN